MCFEPPGSQFSVIWLWARRTLVRDEQRFCQRSFRARDGRRTHVHESKGSRVLSSRRENCNARSRYSPVGIEASMLEEPSSGSKTTTYLPESLPISTGWSSWDGRRLRRVGHDPERIFHIPTTEGWLLTFDADRSSRKLFDMIVDNACFDFLLMSAECKCGYACAATVRRRLGSASTLECRVERV